VLTFAEENRSRNIEYRDLLSRIATSNTVLRLRAAGQLLAKRGGLSLKGARSVVERLAVGDTILMVELHTDAPHALAFDLAQVGIHAVFFKNLEEVFGAL
jgi:hypothetical protein